MASNKLGGNERAGGGNYQDHDESILLLDLALTLAKQAGALLLEGIAGKREVETKSSPTDVVTEMDGRSERLIVSGIKAVRPNDAILAEEGNDSKGTSGLTWVIDPLDGTVNYLYKLAPFAVSIAACQDGKPLVGVVHDPVHDETFSATAGRGAYLNGQPLCCPDASQLDLALIGTGFSYTKARRLAQAEVLARLLPQVRDVRRAGAAAIDLCWVAAGRLNAYYEAGLQPWDYAAGELIVAESGGSVTSLEGADPSRLPTVVASASSISTQFLDALRQCGARSVPK